MQSQEKRRKVYEIQTQLYDVYGQPYLDVNALMGKVESLAKTDTDKPPVIRLFAWVIHNRDTYTEEEVSKATKAIQVGDSKPEHLHCVINLSNGMTPSAVCKLLNIDPRQLVYVKRREGDDEDDNDTFKDKAMYLCHRRQPEKAQYEFEEIHCNFNYAEEFKKYCQTSLRKSKSKHSQAFIKEHLNKLSLGEETTQDIIRIYGYDAYEYAKAKFDHAQQYYEKTALNPVPIRLTFLITGPSTTGKTPLAKLYACSLFPDLKPQEAFFLASDSENRNNTFSSYMGQPVIIYDDWRAVSFITCFGREKLFNSLFAVHPEPSAFNIKYGSMVLKHSINIITTVEDPDNFIRGIAGEYKDMYGNYHQSESGQVLQSYKRFWSITQISEEEIIIKINAGFLDGSRLAYYQQYITLATLNNNIKALVEKYHPELYASIGSKKFPELVAQTNAQVEKSDGKITDPNQISIDDIGIGTTYNIDYQMQKLNGGS